MGAPDIVGLIHESGLTIYDDLAQRPELFIETGLLERLLRKSLLGFRLNFPLRTRSKVIKSQVAEALGYPVPARFQKTRPRFPGQNLDTYVQKSDNLQIWNEEVSPSRRYSIFRLDSNDRITHVRVVEGRTLSSLDTTGTLTQKYQAKSIQQVSKSVLVSPEDTARLKELIRSMGKTSGSHAPTTAGDLALDPSRLLPVGELYRRLLPILGTSIRDPGRDQERKRGTILHKAVCVRLGGPPFSDQGQFPDLPYQLLEVKLQTSPTIDLGLVSPGSTQPLGSVPGLRHRDVRYALFYGVMDGDWMRVEHLIVATGEDFFTFFRRFGGKIVNKKLQLPLPPDFFR